MTRAWLVRRVSGFSGLLLLLAGVTPAIAQPAGPWVVLSWNDLGMHCINRNHANLSVLPPYNNLWAQVIQRGNAISPPRVLTAGVTVEYSIPGNTTSITKTDFWTWDQHLFGVDLPPDVGLAGKGLSGTFDAQTGYFTAVGIPITPFTDAAPTVEDPYQQALVILRDAGGVELARSRPVIPVSAEMNCVSSGCHASENAILSQHAGPGEGGFDPANRPILCAGCHGDPALGGTGPGDAGWFSQVMHEKHAFIDEQIPGVNGCYKCHPGPVARCSRGTMATDHNLTCQDCHGTLHDVADTIGNGRTPWLDEPACRTCHTAAFGEPAGQLYRLSTGHGGVYCEACHGSTHADFPTRLPRDNADMIALQGHAGVLSDCTVCHGINPAGPGPHGVVATAVVEDEVLRGAARLTVSPSPLRAGRVCTIAMAASPGERGRLLVFDARGRTVRRLETTPGAGGTRQATWDGRDHRGNPAGPGVYFLRWSSGTHTAAAKLVLASH